MSDIVFVPNPLVEEELAQSPEMQAAMTSAANEVATVARQLAPVDTGALRDSIHVDLVDGEAEVIADVPYAIFVEFGTSVDEAQPYLRPAADAVVGRGPE